MNALILGLGSIGRRHARVLRSIDPNFTIFALRSGKTDGSEEGVMDIHATSEVESVDLAIISSPTDRHRSDIEKVLPFKPFFFLEKPLALSVRDGEAIVDMMSREKCESYVGCVFRFLPGLRELHDEYQKNPRKITSVRAVCRSWLPDWQPGRDYQKSFRADAAQSGGVHLELIHELDYVTWIFGNPQKRTVELREVPELNITAPAEAHYELTYPDFSATIDLSYASKTRERFLEVIFTDGSQTRVEVITSDDLYTAQLQHVLACIAGKETSIHTAEDALQTLKLALPEA